MRKGEIIMQNGAMLDMINRDSNICIMLSYNADSKIFTIESGMNNIPWVATKTSFTYSDIIARDILSDKEIADIQNIEELILNGQATDVRRNMTVIYPDKSLHNWIMLMSKGTEFNDNNRQLKVCVVNIDKEIKIIEGLRYHKEYDTLTGLYNRETFFKKAEEIIKRSNRRYIMSCINIGNFKSINEEFGTDTGDDILKRIAEIIKNAIDSEDGICSRIVSDNFAVLFPDTLLYKNTLKKCHEMVRKQVFKGRTLPLSVGRYIITDKTLKASAMYERAFLAMRSVDYSYDNYCKYFDESVFESSLDRSYMYAIAPIAMEQGQFSVSFQPQINMENNHIVGAEVLVRWKHPERGVILPDKFIPVLEKGGFIYTLDKYVWRRACRFLRESIDNGLIIPHLSVNVSRYDLTQKDFIKTITDMIKEYGLTPDKLHLEITESIFETDSEKVSSIIRSLDEYGFVIELDDFGTGYSSLSALNVLPIDIVKIDRSFINNYENKYSDNHMLASIIRMLRWQGMNIIVEGVENITQSNYLRSLGCYFTQGFFYSEPISEKEFIKFLEKGTVESELNKSLHSSVRMIENINNISIVDELVFNDFAGAAFTMEVHGEHVWVIRANRYCKKELMWDDATESDMISFDLNDCYADIKDKKTVTRAIVKAIKTHETVSCNVSIRTSHREDIIYLHVNYRLIGQVDNRYMFYVTFYNRDDLEKKSIISDSNLCRRNKNILSALNSVSYLYDVENEKISDIGEIKDIIGYDVPRNLIQLIKNKSGHYAEKRYAIIEKSIRNVVKTKKNDEILFPISNSGDVTKYIRIIMIPECDGNGKVAFIYGAVTEASNLNGELMSHIVSAPGGLHIYYLGEPIHLQYASEGLCKMLGYTVDEFQKKSDNVYTNVVHKDDVDKFNEFISGLAKKPGTDTIEYRMICKDGHIIHVSDTMESVYNYKGELIGYSSITDITNVISQRDYFEKIAYIDLQTSLPNKSCCEELFEDDSAADDNVCCIMFDLNELKKVNDTEGHLEGDKLIRKFANILRSSISYNDFVGRFGGDEFVAVLHNSDDIIIRNIFETIAEKVNKYNINKSENRMSYSAGYCKSNEFKGYTLKQLLGVADKRMYNEKKSVR